MNLNIKNTPKRPKKKEAILESAVKIFALNGYNNTRLEQITHDLQLSDKAISCSALCSTFIAYIPFKRMKAIQKFSLLSKL